MGQTSPPALAQPVLEHVRGASVADVGCGSGVFGYVMRVSWHFTGSWRREGITTPERLVGIDFSPVAIDRLRGFNIYDELLLADASTLPLEDASVDTALSMENLEHLFPADVVPALRELARIARRRVVVSTPAPWMVINRGWLASEILEAKNDTVPMGYDEFLVLAGCIHKAVIEPERMRSMGFQVVELYGRPVQVQDSLIYWAEPADIRLDRLGVPGIGINGYPADDGRSDWREEYLRFLRASEAVPTSTYRRPKPTLRSRASRVLRAYGESN